MVEFPSMDDLLIILFLFFLSALFSGSEVAIFSLKESFISRISQGKKFLDRSLSALLTNKSNCLIVILVGNLIVNIFLSSMISKKAMDSFGPAALPYAVFILTILLILFSEITPKTIALKNSETFGYLSSPFLNLIRKTIFPLIQALEAVSQSFLNFLFGEKKTSDHHLSSDELSTLVSLGERQGVFYGWERKLIEQILEFQEVYAVERMVPRPDILAVELHEDREAILNKVKGIPHSKIPVYQDNLDHIISYFQVKEFLLFPEKSVEEIMKPVYVIPEMKPLDKLLQEMQIQNQKMAVLVDEYGNMQGIITLEDVLEAIFGGWSQDERTVEPDITRSSQGVYRVQGSTSCRELNTYFDWDYFDEDFESGETIAGLILANLNKLPAVGDRLDLEGVALKVTRVIKRRIMEVEIRFTKKDQSAGDEL